MIRFSTLLFLSLFAMSAIAAERPKGGSLVIATYDNSALRVTIDGRTFNGRDNYFAISNIEQGYHTVQIYRANSSRNPIDIFGRNREQLVFNNSVYIKKNTEVEITINRNGRARIQENKMKNRDSRDYDWNDRNSRDDRYGNGGYDRNDDRYGRDDDRYGRDDDRYGRNDGGYGNNSGRIVSLPEFLSMKEALRRENFENSRMGLARQMFDANNFKADQVRDLLQMFSFENYKLDLAKYAYRTTIDKNNYYVVNDVLNYNSRQELARYINQYR